MILCHKRLMTLQTNLPMEVKLIMVMSFNNSSILQINAQLLITLVNQILHLLISNFKKWQIYHQSHIRMNTRV
jgi:hypothetical protein